MRPTNYILLMKCSFRFKLYVFENHISINLLVYEKYTVYVCVLGDFAPRLGPRQVTQLSSS
jgi:hypothetical protein